jgi:hypothetical protein
LQFLDISFDIRLKWPQALIDAFVWLKSLTQGLQLAAPECLSGSWNYYLEVELILIAVACMYATAFIYAEIARGNLKLIRVAANPDDKGVWLGFIPARTDTLLDYVDTLVLRRNQMKQVIGFMTAIAYIYVVGALLKAWDCVETSNGRVMRSDTTITCDSPKLLAFRRIAAAVVVVAGGGVPVATALWVRRLRRQTKADSGLRRTAWKGLADPVTRAGWGPFYEVRPCRSSELFVCMLRHSV